jgi:hypothetical protein
MGCRKFLVQEVILMLNFPLAFMSSRPYEHSYLSFSRSDLLMLLSFYLFLLLVSAWVIGWAGNKLLRWAGMNHQLPFREALAISLLAGLVSLGLLTLAVQARQWTRPERWLPASLVGPPFSIEDDQTERAVSAETVTAQLELAVVEKLQALRDQLLVYAAAHQDAYPTTRDDAGFPAESWDFPDGWAGEFQLIPGRIYANLPIPLVITPEIAGRQQVLFVSGQIVSVAPQTVPRLLAEAPDSRPSAVGREESP